MIQLQHKSPLCTENRLPDNVQLTKRRANDTSVGVMSAQRNSAFTNCHGDISTCQQHSQYYRRNVGSTKRQFGEASPNQFYLHVDPDLLEVLPLVQPLVFQARRNPLKDLARLNLLKDCRTYCCCSFI